MYIRKISGVESSDSAVPQRERACDTFVPIIVSK